MATMTHPTRTSWSPTAIGQFTYVQDTPLRDGEYNEKGHELLAEPVAFEQRSQFDLRI
jgi:hypothetical protein